MRVKILGEITAERLAEALQAAAEQFEAVRPGHKIYGANLYLNAFDADGLPFDVVDHRGEPLYITIQAKSGELVKPALTAEGEKRREEAKQKARKAQEEAEAKANAEYHQAMAKLAQEREVRRAKEAEAREKFEWLNTTTAELLERDPERFIEELNGAVQAAWQKYQPITKKGLPLALPAFSMHAGSLLLSVETWKSPRRVLNPICTLEHGEIKPFWAHEAWAEAAEKLLDVLLRRSESKE
jgi:hypothetical protein